MLDTLGIDICDFCGEAITAEDRDTENVRIGRNELVADDVIVMHIDC